MFWLLQILFWVSFAAFLHSYIFYPLLMRLKGRNRSFHHPLYEAIDDLPFVSVIMSVYNEEWVIRDKMKSLLALRYPAEKLLFFIGSDCSTDATNAIVSEFAVSDDRIFFFPFDQRRGKPPVINELFDRALVSRPAGPDHLFLITDASVMLTQDTLFLLARHFREPSIGIVDAHMVHTGVEAGGIARAEDQYISAEGRLKYLEGLVWGKMIGPFGGCYALRTTHYTKVPVNYLVDDFYITMRALERGAKAISEPAAICYEPVSHDIREEYRRKSRISAGNFQNLLTFRHLWWPPLDPLRFAFFSHKVLRWLGPFFLIIIFALAGVLSLTGNLFFRSLFVIIVFGALVAVGADLLFSRLGIHVLPLRSGRYFLVMNIALLEGFFKFIKGIRSNVWEPPKRNQ